MDARSLHSNITALQTRLEDHTARTPPPCQSATPLQSAEPPASHTMKVDEPGLPESRDATNSATIVMPAALLYRTAEPIPSYIELRQYFHLPLIEAAQNCGLSATVFKKVCRRNGIRKWPYRQLKSLKSKIVDFQSHIDEPKVQHGHTELMVLSQMTPVEAGCAVATRCLVGPETKLGHIQQRLAATVAKERPAEPHYTQQQDGFKHGVAGHCWGRFVGQEGTMISSPPLKEMLRTLQHVA